MSTFKEAQPRKVPVDNNMFSKPKVSAKTVEELEKGIETPKWNITDHTGFERRTAALQAAVTLQTNPGMGFHPPSFWNNVTHFEAYLRDGTKPL